ncbi:hypothetical protein [Sphingomonas faeni]|uniref:hypothetical protein n=1 Tax=Sphingomonas faeni TaxID=185950 RepID=UPI00335C1A9D
MRKNAASNAYMWRVGPAMVGYIICLLGSRTLLAMHPTGTGVIALAVLPALPLCVVVWAMGRYVTEERDEYLRAQFLRHATIATGVLLAVTTIWGFLEDADAVRHVPFYWTFILWLMALGATQIVARVVRLVQGETP